MMASRAGMGSSGPNKSSMSIKSSLECVVGRVGARWAVTCDRRAEARGLRSHQASRRLLTWTKRSLRAPQPVEAEAWVRWISRRFAAFVGSEARLRGEVCVFCLWKSLDGMIWSACRCDVPLHLSGVRVASTYLSRVSYLVSPVPRQAHGACSTELEPTRVASREGKRSDDMSARGWGCWMVAQPRASSLEPGVWTLVDSTQLDSCWVWTAAQARNTGSGIRGH